MRGGVWMRIVRNRPTILPLQKKRAAAIATRSQALRSSVRNPPVTALKTELVKLFPYLKKELMAPLARPAALRITRTEWLTILFIKPPVTTRAIISLAMNCRTKLSPGNRLSNALHRKKRTATAPHPQGNTSARPKTGHLTAQHATRSCN